MDTNPLRDFTLAACRSAHPVIILVQTLGSEHVLHGGPDESIYLLDVSAEDARAACELAGLDLPRELRETP